MPINDKFLGSDGGILFSFLGGEGGSANFSFVMGAVICLIQEDQLELLSLKSKGS